MVAVAGLSIATHGCTALCNGPGCEDFYPLGRLSVLPGVSTAGPLDAWDDAIARIDGLDADGAGWSVAPLGGEAVILGEPTADPNRVVTTTAPDGVTVASIAPEGWVASVVSAFGASVVAEPTGPAGDEAATFDLWVSAPDAGYGRGALYLFRDAEADRAVDLAGAELTLFSDDQSPDDGFGTRITVCADLTADGLPDYAVSAPRFAAPRAGPLAGVEVPDLAGGVFLIRSDAVAERAGTVAPWDVARVWWGVDAGEGAGAAVVCDRDLDGDGLIDIVIGAPWADDARGRLYVVSGDPLPPSGPLDAFRSVASPEDTDGWFGQSVATLAVGDDTWLAVGAPGTGRGAGRVHLYDGRSLTERVAVFQHDRIPDHFGRWLYSGYLDGDADADLIVGAPDYKGAGTNDFDTGRIWIWYGAERDSWDLATASDAAGLEIGGTAPFQRVGRDLVVADRDGDGLDELWVPTSAADAQ